MQIQKYSTQMYRAPEMVDLYTKQLINEKVDIWALGCILYSMVYLLHPFQDNGKLAILNGASYPKNGPPFSKYAKSLIKYLLTSK